VSPIRTVVITGASRGLGFASAIELYRRGWRVVAAVRSPLAGLRVLRQALGAPLDDPRLIGVALDLLDSGSVLSAAQQILDTVGGPYAVVHNAGVAAAGFSEETPAAEWSRIFATNVFGPAQLTTALLPRMREAGKGRVVVVSSTSALRGMPVASVYSASKAAAERWAESLAAEVAPYGLGVTVLLAGTFDTDIARDATPIYHDHTGPYAVQHSRIEKRGRLAMRLANSPERFARALAKSLERDVGPFVHRGIGVDAKSFKAMTRLVPSVVMHHLVRIALGQPRFGVMRRAEPIIGDWLTEGNSDD
jgi:NAD(P)-dependent dehydrogenase (short-subunit alcohol dehydrogenase family)